MERTRLMGLPPKRFWLFLTVATPTLLNEEIEIFQGVSLLSFYMRRKEPPDVLLCGAIDAKQKPTTTTAKEWTEKGKNKKWAETVKPNYPADMFN